MFALRAGILTNKKDKSRTGCSNSFVHKTVQEFLAAYHIACNPNVIDDIVSGYLKRNTKSYLEISQVFIFLCGMNISPANKLSALMNQRDVVLFGPSSFGSRIREFQRVIGSGIREAVANKQDDICLKLSYCCIETRNITENKARDLNLMLSTITSTLQSLSAFSYFDEPTSPVEVNLSSCHKLQSLELEGYGIWLRVTASSATSKHPVVIVLNSADQVQCADPRPVLPSIERINLNNVYCSSTWLHSLFSTLLECDHKVVCTMQDCFIDSCANDARVTSTIQTDKHTLYMSGWKHRFDVDNLEILEQCQSPERKRVYRLEMLSIAWAYDSRGAWEALNGLNIKSLTLSCWKEHFEVTHTESLSQALLSLKQLETLTICLLNYIGIQLPHTLKYVNIYCYALYPSELRKLVETLSACAQKIEGKLEFGCSCIKDFENNLELRPYLSQHFHFKRIPVEEYKFIRQELKALKNVAVKRFQIFDRIPLNMRTAYANSASWSERGTDDDHEDFGNVQDDAYRQFITNINDDIMNRISMRFVICPASICLTS